jgi:hypothetical protein
MTMIRGLVFAGEIVDVFSGVDEKTGRRWARVKCHDDAAREYRTFNVSEEHCVIPPPDAIGAWVGKDFMVPIQTRIADGKLYLNIPRGAEVLIERRDSAEFLRAVGE